MSFMRNIFGKGKKKEKEEEDDGRHVRFRSSDSIAGQGRRQADRTFGEESLSAYVRSQGKRHSRGPQSCPGGPIDDTRSVGSTRRGNRSVITPNHKRYNIDYSPEGPSFQLIRGQRKREYRSEIDLSFSDQENESEMRRRERDEHVRVERKMRQYRQRKEELKEENCRLKEENERLRRERTIMDGQFDQMKRELEAYRLRTPWMTSYPSVLPQPGSFPSGSGGSNSTYSRAETDSFMSSSSQRGGVPSHPPTIAHFSGETTTTPHYSPYHYSPRSCHHP